MKMGDVGENWWWRWKTGGGGKRCYLLYHNHDAWHVWHGCSHKPRPELRLTAWKYWSPSREPSKPYSMACDGLGYPGLGLAQLQGSGRALNITKPSKPAKFFGYFPEAGHFPDDCRAAHCPYYGHGCIIHSIFMDTVDHILTICSIILSADGTIWVVLVWLYYGWQKYNYV